MKYNKLNNEFSLIQTDDFNNFIKDPLELLKDYKNKLIHKYFFINLKNIMNGYIFPSGKNYFKYNGLIFCVNNDKKVEDIKLVQKKIRVVNMVLKNQKGKKKNKIINELNNFITININIESSSGKFKGVLSLIWIHNFEKIINTSHLMLNSKDMEAKITFKTCLKDNKLNGKIQLYVLYNGIYLTEKIFTLKSKGIYNKKGILN